MSIGTYVFTADLARTPAVQYDGPLRVEVADVDHDLVRALTWYTLHTSNAKLVRSGEQLFVHGPFSEQLQAGDEVLAWYGMDVATWLRERGWEWGQSTRFELLEKVAEQMQQTVLGDWDQRPGYGVVEHGQAARRYLPESARVHYSIGAARAARGLHGVLVEVEGRRVRGVVS